MLIDKMKTAKKKELRSGQLIFWKPGDYQEDVGVVLDNDWELECTIFWFREPETAGQPDHFCSRWFDDEEGNVFVLREASEHTSFS